MKELDIMRAILFACSEPQYFKEDFANTLLPLLENVDRERLKNISIIYLK